MMTEKDYEEIAKKQAEKNLMDEYWQNVARTSTWISKDGTKTYFRDLTLTHIQHIISGLMTFENENCRIVINKLIIELVVRIKKKTPKYAIDAVEKLVAVASTHANEEESKLIEGYKNCILNNLVDEEGRR